MWWVHIFTALGKWNLESLRFLCRLLNKPLIETWYNCKPNQKLYIRGELPNLSWSQGKQLINMGPNLWIWVGSEPCQGPFKILLDDSIYEEGANHQLLDSTYAVIYPTFNISKEMD